MPEPRTRKGRVQRQAIVAAAAALMYERGIRGTSLDDIAAASAAGKGQLYHYFSGKDELTVVVLEHQLTEVLGKQAQFRIDTWAGVKAWLDGLVYGQHRRGYGGCPVGSLAIEMAAMGHELRKSAKAAFDRWQKTIEEGLNSLKDRGALPPRTDTTALAASTLTTIQGGYLLSSVAHDLEPMRHATRDAYDAIRASRG